MVPDNKLYVIDLTTNPPALIDTVAVGKQPSGMSINRAGNLALIANRADNSISVLRIAGKKVTLIDTVTIGEQVAHVVFAPDGKRAVAGKFPGHKLALLEVNGEKVVYTKQDIPVGLWPYNFDIAPDGKLALSADNGAAGRSDGNADTVTVIDLESNPPRGQRSNRQHREVADATRSALHRGEGERADTHRICCASIRRTVVSRPITAPSPGRYLAWWRGMTEQGTLDLWGGDGRVVACR